MTWYLSRYMRTDVINRPIVCPTRGSPVRNSEKLPRVKPGISTIITPIPPTAVAAKVKLEIATSVADGFETRLSKIVVVVTRRSAYKPIIRSTTTVATASALRLGISRAMNTALKRSPPTLPTETKFSKNPRNPRRNASRKRKGIRSAQTNRYQRTKVTQRASMASPNADANIAQSFGRDRSCESCWESIRVSNQQMMPSGRAILAATIRYFFKLPSLEL